MTIKFFDKSKIEVNTTKLPRYPNQWSHWDFIRSLNRDCFDISPKDDLANSDLVLIDYYHKGEKGQHTVSVKNSPTEGGMFKDKWMDVSPKLSDIELPAFIEGMSVACKLMHAIKEKKER